MCILKVETAFNLQYFFVNCSKIFLMYRLYNVLAIVLFYCLSACQQAPPVNADLSLKDLSESLESVEMIARGEGDDAQGTERNTAQNNLEQQTGVLTAGRWSDLDNWSFWQQLMQKELFFSFQECWSMYPNQRYALELLDAHQNAVSDCQVQLLDDKQTVLWQTRTNNAGKANLFSNPFVQSIKLANQIQINYAGENYSLDAKIFAQGVNRFTLPVEASPPPAQIDLMFIIDATGSMEDEINYLKNELEDVVQQINSRLPEHRLQTASVFYRDKGEEYIMRSSDFTTEISQTLQFFQKQHAKDGGDYPEALDLALEEAINNQNWSSDATTRLAFIMMDAPPHHDLDSKSKMQKVVKNAASKGIRLIPIAASGIDKETEFLMRFCAMLCNGEYVFITDHSGVGNGHIEPTIGDYRVQFLNDLLADLIVEAAQNKNSAIQ